MRKETQTIKIRNENGVLTIAHLDIKGTIRLYLWKLYANQFARLNEQIPWKIPYQTWKKMKQKFSIALYLSKKWNLGGGMETAE